GNGKETAKPSAHAGMLARGTGEKKAGRSAFQSFGGHDLDSETSKTDIGALARCQQAHRRDPQILQDLRTQADLAPLLRARRLGAGVAMRNVSNRNTGSAVTQVDNHPAPGSLEARERGANRPGAAKYITDDVGAMQPRRDVPAVRDIAIDEGHVMHAVKRGDVGIPLQRADFGGDLEFAHPL